MADCYERRGKTLSLGFLNQRSQDKLERFRTTWRVSGICTCRCNAEIYLQASLRLNTFSARWVKRALHQNMRSAKGSSSAPNTNLHALVLRACCVLLDSVALGVACSVFGSGEVDVVSVCCVVTRF